MSTPKKLLQRAVKYFPPAGGAAAGGKVLYHPLELLYRPLETGAGGKVLLYRPPEPQKQARKEETRTSMYYLLK
jgi:hypothetical protein